MLNDNIETLIQTFSENYFEKLYYFCLKKVSDVNDAEDLTADISLDIISALRKGIKLENFSAWVWKIARNKYAAWVDKKSNRVNNLIENEYESLEISDTYDLENDLIHQEDLKLLRRELAFISSEYRNIVVAFYIDYRKIDDIANSLNLPIGTIKSKLFRARNILKEGISMAREFGTLSYKPENIGFFMNGFSGKNGEPWSVIEKKLNKNILLATYRTPSTAEELAIEIGMALPYLEDELDMLVQGEFLRKNGNKYETNLFIVSTVAQEKIYAHLYEIQSSITEKIINLIENQVKSFDENDFQWHESYQPYDDMKWALLMQKIDEVSQRIANDIHEQRKFVKKNLGRYGHTLRPNGGEWDLLGMEEYLGNRPEFVGLHGCMDTPNDLDFINFGQFKFKYKRIEFKTPTSLSYQQVKVLVAAANQNINGINQQILDELIGYGYLDDKYQPTFRVTFQNKIGEFTESQKEIHDKLYNEAYNIAMKHYNFCREIIYNEIPDFFKNDQYQIDHACVNIFQMRGAVLEGALKSGYISYSDDDQRKMLGAYLII